MQKIGLVAGEASGDQLGGPLIASLKKQFPEATFVGIGGPQMQAQGLTSLFPMERLSVMGLVDPLKRLPELLRIRRTLYQHFLENKFDLVVGIDAPDFNLGLELRLRQQGIKTAHYVSPSVWAWRQGRIKKIAKAVDHMLTLLPFEKAFYDKHQVPATFVGHPLADTFAMQPDQAAARQQLGLPNEATIITLMPGSRQSEVAMLGQLFMEVAQRCVVEKPALQFVLPAASAKRKQQIDELLREYPDLPVNVLDGQSHQAMAAADLVVLASGTTALEAMLLKKPMVVSYKIGALTYSIVKRMVKVDYVSLPNLLADRPLVKEFLQQDATVENIAGEVLGLLANPEHCRQLIATFEQLHLQLKQNASDKAALALASLIR